MHINAYYVYEHWRPDTGVCFYVGKGKGRRAWDLKNMRNRHFKAVVSKLIAAGLAVDVRIIVCDVSAEAALALEISRIAFYGQKNLTNMTRGGDGLLSPSMEVRQRISSVHKARWQQPAYRQRMIEAAKRKPPMSAEARAKLSAAAKGRTYSPEVIERYRAAAKKRGVSQATREAQKKAVTGKPRKPHTAESKELMRVAALKREAVRRTAKEAA